MTTSEQDTPWPESIQAAVRKAEFAAARYLAEFMAKADIPFALRVNAVSGVRMAIRGVLPRKHSRIEGSANEVKP